MDLGAKGPWGAVAGGRCHPGPCPHPRSKAFRASGGQGRLPGGAEQQRQCTASSQFAPARNNDDDSSRNREMKNVSAILMSWKHPAQGMERQEGGSRPAIAVTLRAPAAKGVPNASKMWNPSRGAAWLSAAVAAQGSNWEDYPVGNCSQGREVSDSPSTGFHVCTKQLL